MGHLLLVVEVDVLPAHPLDLGDRVGHRRLHADAEHVELEEAQGLDVVLVELAHREPQPARLDRGAVEQARVGQHDAAGVQRDVARETVEGLDEVEEGRHARAVEAAAAQFGQVGDGVAGVLGADVRERLGDLVDLGGGQPERGADVAHGVAHLVGVHHRHARHPLTAEPGEHGLVDLGAPGRLDVDVDVGQFGAQRGAEPLHEQPVADRVDPADAQEVVDQAAGARAAGGHPHPAGPDEVGDLGDGEEVRGVAQGLDDGQFLVEPVEHHLSLGLPGPRVAAGDPVATALREHRHGVVGGAEAEHLRLGQVHRPDAEVGPGLLGALGRDEGGHRDEAIGTGAVSPGDLEGVGAHLRGAREVPGVGDPVEVARVEDDEAAGGVEQVDGAHLVGVDVAHRGGEDGGDAGRVGEGEQPGSVRPASGGSFRTTVQHHLDGETVTGQHRLPGREQVPGAVSATREGCPPDVGVGAEQHEQPTRPTCLPDVVSPGGQQITSGHRDPPLAAQVGLRDEPAQGSPPRTGRHPGDLAAGEHAHPWAAGVDDGPTPHGGARALGVTHGIRSRTAVPGGTASRDAAARTGASNRTTGAHVDGEVDPEDRVDAGPPARRGELHRAVEPVTVGEGQRTLAVGDGALDELLGHRGAVAHREPRGDVEVGEPVHDALRPSARARAAAGAAPRAPRGDGPRGRRRSRRPAAGRRPRGR